MEPNRSKPISISSKYDLHKKSNFNSDIDLESINFSPPELINRIETLPKNEKRII